jgi:hypothetical protein
MTRVGENYFELVDERGRVTRSIVHADAAYPITNRHIGVNSNMRAVYLETTNADAVCETPDAVAAAHRVLRAAASNRAQPRGAGLTIAAADGPRFTTAENPTRRGAGDGSDPRQPGPAPGVGGGSQPFPSGPPKIYGGGVSGDGRAGENAGVEDLVDGALAHLGTEDDESELPRHERLRRAGSMLLEAANKLMPQAGAQHMRFGRTGGF